MDFEQMILKRKQNNDELITKKIQKNKIDNFMKTGYAPKRYNDDTISYTELINGIKEINLYGYIYKILQNLFVQEIINWDNVDINYYIKYNKVKIIRLYNINHFDIYYLYKILNINIEFDKTIKFKYHEISDNYIVDLLKPYNYNNYSNHMDSYMNNNNFILNQNTFNKLPIEIRRRNINEYINNNLISIDFLSFNVDIINWNEYNNYHLLPDDFVLLHFDKLNKLEIYKYKKHNLNIINKVIPYLNNNKFYNFYFLNTSYKGTNIQNINLDILESIKNKNKYIFDIICKNHKISDEFYYKYQMYLDFDKLISDNKLSLNVIYNNYKISKNVKLTLYISKSKILSKMFRNSTNLNQIGFGIVNKYDMFSLFQN